MTFKVAFLPFIWRLHILIWKSSKKSGPLFPGQDILYFSLLVNSKIPNLLIAYHKIAYYFFLKFQYTYNALCVINSILFIVTCYCDTAYVISKHRKICYVWPKTLWYCRNYELYIILRQLKTIKFFDDSIFIIRHGL